MSKTKLEIGDVFEIPLDEPRDKCGYFQWIAIDENQLRSDVIRVFATSKKLSEPELGTLMQADVLFYAHCVIPAGIRLGVWKKVGKMECPEYSDVTFRATLDFGRDEIKVSKRWYIWRINEPKVFVGKLKGKLGDAEPGEVFPPGEILYRLENGHYKQPYQR